MGCYSFKYMKLTIYFVILSTLLSCSSQKTKVSPDEYLKLNKLHHAKHQACIQHRKQVLEKPISITEEAELNDELYFFIRNEKQARTYIDSFDISKFTLKENQLEYEAIIMGCVLERHPKHETCDTLFTTYKYFRGMIYGMNQYSWSAETKAKAKTTMFQYMEYVGQSDSSLMDVMFANDLLMRLSQYGYVSENIYQDSVTLKRDAEATFKELKKKVKKLGKTELTCDDAGDFYSAERVKVKELSQKFLVILNKAK